ncbi:cytochrome P450, putative [Talaromyces stipitatus ATCC 10500]|uniref:Cytochrome P450, putative n=1 Tax=Talaromyces stipitatus (strain ATCC 10500 / CBS 375.48 / QM 6759 / NRRL 1006) TaxID=441959 RepID=B8M3L5_TALSN|nr:cytochrome P450, putative [Talaromyces stipitatus ATCC 10500]EED22387.1 cytochrome P450, putative [Talaromyces stipitatus ATCC 10500]
MYLSRLLALFLVGFLIYRSIKARVRKRQIRQKEAQLGCLPPPVFKLTNGLGLPIKKESIQATNEDRNPQYIMEAMDSISPDCHTVRVPIFDYEIFVTRDPENMRAIFSTQAKDFDISYFRQLSWLPMIGKGIFTTRGWDWKHSRSRLRPQFARDIVSDVDREQRHVMALMKRLPSDAMSKWTEKVDLQPLFFNFTLDTASEFLYGLSVHSQQGTKEGIEMAAHFHNAKMAVHRRIELDKFYWLINTSKFRKACNSLHKWVDGIVAARLAQLKQQQEKSGYGDDEPKQQRFVLLDELAKYTQDLNELRGETLNVLVAGRDTTGSLLGWVFYFLVRHPEVYAKLREIVIDTFGSHPTRTKIDFNILRNCAYLQHVMKEALRIATVIPMNERVALRDTTLPVGGGEDRMGKVFIPAGTQILIPTYAMQHRRDLWGPDVEEFKPERWESKKQPGWEFIPFGAGDRKCLGQQFAFTETGYVIVRFCQRFDRMENMEEGDGRIRLHHAIENRSGTGVQARLHEADYE